MFAKRTDWVLTPNRLTQTLHKIRASGHAVVDLTESNPTRCGFHYPAELLASLNEPENLKYAPLPKGLLEARKAVSSYYSEKGIRIDPEQIILTASTSEAYSFLFRLLLNPGERLLVPRPSYPLFAYLATLNDVVLDPYPLKCKTTWGIDQETLQESIHPETRAVILVHPNNPTGSYVKLTEKEYLVPLAKENRLSLICDEVFLDYAYEKDSSRLATFAGCDEVLTFTLSGISKILGLPQMKLSWIVVNGPRELREQAIERLEVISDTYLSVSTPFQQALEMWFSFRPALQDQIQKRILTNREILLERCRTGDGELLNGEGGWYAILHFPHVEDEEEWVLGLLEKESVLVHPGYFYDFEEGSHGVASLLLPAQQFREGIGRLCNYMGKKEFHKFKRHNI